MRADSLRVSGMVLKYDLVSMTFHTEKQAGMIIARGESYIPRRMTKRNEGIRPPEKNMVIRRYILRYFRPIRFLNVRGKAPKTEVTSMRQVVQTVYITVFPKARHIFGSFNRIW